MTDEIRLSSGQLARMNNGVVEVLPGSHHYSMTTVHASGAVLTARCREYQPLLDFLHQLERFQYDLHTIQLEPGS